MTDATRARPSVRQAVRAGGTPVASCHRFRGRTFAAQACAALVLAGCSQVEPVGLVEPITDPARVYLRLVINHPAVNLTADATDPGANTLQLVATPYNAAGEAMADAPAPTFQLLGTDTTKLKVAADGRLQGLQPETGVRVLAELTIDGVRQTDTTVVNITSTAPAPVLDTFSIHVPAESALWYPAQGITAVLASFAGLVPRATLQLHAVDPNGAPIPDLSVNYQSLDTAIARLDPRSGAVTLLGPGEVRVVARTMAYGIAKADTMKYAVQPSFGTEVLIYPEGFSPRLEFHPPVGAVATRTIVAGGIVGWSSQTNIPIDITFDDPTNVVAPPDVFCQFLLFFFPPSDTYCQAGNIPAFSRDPVTLQTPEGDAAGRWRQFPVAGTYTFHSTLTGARGQIVVVAPTPPVP